MRRSAGLFAIALGLMTASPAVSWAQGTNLPWGQSSDMVAWEMFVQIVAPAGIPGSKNVVFETWASDQDIFVAAPQVPRWPGVAEPKRLSPSLLGQFVASVRPIAHVITPDRCHKPHDGPAGDFPPNACIGEEVRRNWSSFQYLVANGLYTRAGLADAYAKGLKVDFPADAVEAKGDWVKVDDVVTWINSTIKPTPPLTAARVRELYHTNTASDGTGTFEYALVGVAMSSKQIKDWVWATFEHQLSPGRCDDIGCRDAFGAAVANVPPKNTGGGQRNQYYGTCERSAAGKAMLDNAGLSPVWQNYCLKGSQITFTAGSAPTLLGNSVVERINAGVPIPTSSCITCHSYAAYLSTGKAFTTMLEKNPTGAFDPSKLEQARQSDFIWGILLAK